MTPRHARGLGPLESLLELLVSTLTVYEPRMKQLGISVRSELESISRTLCYSSEVRQVFANLIGNALDACESGGIIRLRTRDSFHAQTGLKGVRVTIADNGTGMKPETKSRLFEPFFTTKGINGTGLGLWVSSEIFDRHRATVRVKSRQSPPCGTVFSLSSKTIPILSCPLDER
jgi:signal transduction histidine kinase